jgi:hypothetical protein
MYVIPVGQMHWLDRALIIDALSERLALEGIEEYYRNYGFGLEQAMVFYRRVPGDSP